MVRPAPPHARNHDRHRSCNREYGPGGKIPAQFMVGAMSLTQSALASVLVDEIADPREALDAVTAWNKLLLVQLSVLLLGYLLPQREARD